MSSKSNIPKDIKESVRDTLGKSIKLGLLLLVRMETKADKMENKILAFTACRLFIFSAKVPTKIEITFNYLDVETIESKKRNQLCLAVGGKIMNFSALETETDEVDQMILQICTCLKSIFPTVPLEKIIRKIDVQPSERVKPMYQLIKEIESKDPGPCGGFSQMYACMCDYHDLPYREEVAWDVDTIYLSHDSKELCLQDFDHLESKDLIPIIAGLEYNTWFTSLRISNTKLVPEAAEQIVTVLRKSMSIEEIYLDGMGIKWEYAHKLSMALLSNNSTPLHTIDLSNNPIEDKGASHLSGMVGKTPKGLIHLNLAKTSLTTKGINTLSHALSLNKFMPSSLTYLNLSDNVFKEDVNNLYNFLAQPNALSCLDLSGTECALDLVCGALLRGCCQNLCHLNLSRNFFSSKKSKDTNLPPSFKQFFSSCLALKYLNMSCTKIPSEALKALLLGIHSNVNVTDLELDLSSNDLRGTGAQVLEICLGEVNNISSLDISDNGFDHDLAGVLMSLVSNTGVKHLYIGRNFNNMKAKHLVPVLDAIVQIVQEDDSVLETLSLADSKLKADLCNVINALGSNQSLTKLDLSGNYMGDTGAKVLAKALQINTKLKTIIWDRNNVTHIGFHDIALALQKNVTVTNMPFPVHDAALSLKTNPERTESTLKQIEASLFRNHSPQKSSKDQVYRLQQGILLSSTQQMVDRLVVQVQDLINTLKKNNQPDCKGDIDQALSYIKDADNSKLLLSHLHDIALKSEEPGSNIEQKLQNITQELKKVIEQQLQMNVKSMIRSAEDQCPHVLKERNVKEQLMQGCIDKSIMPKDFIEHCIVESGGADILNKVSELNLAVAAYVSDKILDEVIESLTRSYKILMEHRNNKNSGDGLNQRSNSLDSDSTKEFIINKGDAEKPDSPVTRELSTKRKSVMGRKLRPQSVIELESLHQENAEDSGKSEEDLFGVAGGISQKLDHLGKDRPKRMKTRPPTRPCVSSSQVIEDVQDINEGVEVFFDRSMAGGTVVTPTSPDEYRSCKNIGSPVQGQSPLNDRSPIKEHDKMEIEKDKEKKEKEKEKDKDRDKEKDKIKEKEKEKEKEKDKEKEKSDKDSEKKEKGSIFGKIFSRHSPEPSRSPMKEIDTKIISSTTIIEKTELIHQKEEEIGENKEALDADKDSPDVLRRPAGISKIGVGMGGSILAEMKARQKKTSDKSSPVSPVSDRENSKDESLSPTQTQSTKPPFNLSSPSHTTKGQTTVTSFSSSTITSSTTSSKFTFQESKTIHSSEKTVSEKKSTGDQEDKVHMRNKPTPPLKPKPPPVAPKPRPRSTITSDCRLSGEFSPTSEPSSTTTTTPNTPDSIDALETASIDSGVVRDSPRSVRDLAASLENTDITKRKSSSLPRTSTQLDTTADANLPRSQSLYTPKDSSPGGDNIASRKPQARSSLTSVRTSRELSGLEELQEDFNEPVSEEEEERPRPTIRERLSLRKEKEQNKNNGDSLLEKIVHLPSNISDDDEIINV